MDTIPTLNPLTIRTTKHGKTIEDIKKGEDHERPLLCLMAQLFHEPGSNVYIIGIMGSKTKIRPDVFKENLVHTFLKNRRFSSLQVKFMSRDILIYARHTIINYVIYHELF